MEEKKSGGLAVASLVLGIIGIVLSFIPVINNVAFFLGVLALIFAIISLIKKAKKGMAIAGLVLGILAIVITLLVQQSVSDAIDDLSDDFDKMSGSKTEEVLKNDADVTLGKFEVKTDEYGYSETKLVVTLTNKTSKTQNFSVKVEAKDKNGSRIEIDDAYFDTVAAGQTKSRNL